MDSLWSLALAYFTGKTPFNYEMRAFGIALQGAMAVRNGPNRNKDMHWFHAFALTTVLGFGGGWLGFMWMGKPTSMIASADVNFPLCMAAFVIAHYTPRDVGYKVAKTLPGKILYTALAQLFRALGMIGFINTAAAELKPSPYYPVPVLGPIIYGTLLGNMGGFLRKGFDGHLKGGIPWPFQFGIVVGAFYHFFVHDQEGPVGIYLRSGVTSIGDGALLLGLDEKTFATLFVSVFSTVAGIVMLPEFMGPSFSPILTPSMSVGKLLVTPFATSEPLMSDKELEKEFAQDKPDKTVGGTTRTGRKNKKKKA